VTPPAFRTLRLLTLAEVVELPAASKAFALSEVS
jgi:hypothetical protein